MSSMRVAYSTAPSLHFIVMLRFVSSGTASNQRDLQLSNNSASISYSSAHKQPSTEFKSIRPPAELSLEVVARKQQLDAAERCLVAHDGARLVLQLLKKLRRDHGHLIDDQHLRTCQVTEFEGHKLQRRWDSSIQYCRNGHLKFLLMMSICTCAMS